MTSLLLSRRAVLAGGSLLVAFTLAQAAEQLPGGDLKIAPDLDSWIRIDPDGQITVFTGKAELGQGISTAFVQIAAEELDVGLAQITLITADTARTPDEGYTAGSHSMQDSGTAIRGAAADVRALLLQAAASHWNLSPGQLRTQAGQVVAPDGRRLGYGELAGGVDLHRPAPQPHPLKPPAGYNVLGKSLPRLDIPAKLTGIPSFVHDLRLSGMLHGRVVRPIAYGGKLLQVNKSVATKISGVVKVVREGSFLGVIAEREFSAIQAMRALAASAQWAPGHNLPEQSAVAQFLQSAPHRDISVIDRPSPSPPNARTVHARYSRPFLAHGSIGPSCAVALCRNDGSFDVWTHTQGVFPLRRALAQMLKLPEEKVRCIHQEGAGCYGQNGADDAAADATLLARATPGRPIRLQWMREQEQYWEPYGPAMVAEVTGILDASGHVANWDYQVWSNVHTQRPGPAGVLLAAQELEPPFPLPPPTPIPMPEGGGDRNSNPIYDFTGQKVTYHFVPEMPLRVSALRSLGAHLNVFAIESFMDELATAARIDPVDFRLMHLSDPRARDVVRTATDSFGWQQVPKGSGRGLAFARYKNLGAYCAVALQVSVGADRRIQVGRVVAAVDSGQAVNPDGIRNQVEGAIVQSLSWTLYEQVNFTPDHITSRDWSSYPIVRFDGVPESVEVRVVNRPGAPYLGTGECGQGPAAAAIANAVADATGIRLRDMPLRLPTG
jgi:nicotinate dehydrogenase subunit B